MTSLPFEVWIERDGDMPTIRAFTSFATAEKYARGYVAKNDGARLEIKERFVTVAHVRADALGRVWTDLVSGELSV